MKVFLSPKGLHSRAMVRIANALRNHAPLSSGVEIVDDESACDLSILYAIGRDYLDRARDLTASGHKYAVVQCCLYTGGFNPSDLKDTAEWVCFWYNAQAVWSYFDLGRELRQIYSGPSMNFYYAPLGVDDCFRSARLNGHQHERRSVITSGYVSASCAEPIEEVWTAAGMCGLPVIHIGPNKVEGISGPRPSHVACIESVSDAQLAYYYSGAKWVSGLRHGEGFELPAAEGLAMGCRPIMFDQKDVIKWYGNHPMYVPEFSGDELVKCLVEVFRGEYKPVRHDEQAEVLRRFDWRAICSGFWTTLLKEVSA